MKTLVLFSTLTALAVAIPNLSGKQLEESSLLQENKTLKRNTESFDSELKMPIMGLVSESNENQERTFLKKKLLHKKLKKYRNTEESESQGKNMTKSEGTQCNEHKSQEWTLPDLDQAVKVVAEAIDRLEDDINKQEEEKKISESKTRKSRNAENESEEELEEAIKQAKGSLEQLRISLFNLRELRASTECLNSTEHLSSPTLAHETLNEFERLAQWKEAMENIHRNVEIARNLEDNFKFENVENKSDPSSLESEKIKQQMTNNRENQLKGDEKNNTLSPLDKENKPMEKMGHNNTKSDSDSDIVENKQEDQMKKVESDSHVGASNQMVHVLKPETKTKSGMQNSNKSMEAKLQNNKLTDSQMNSKSQQMGQSRFSHQESMRSNDKLHESHAHAQHDQDLISFMKASDEHNQRFHSTKQNNHHESPMGSHGMMPHGRSAEMANVMSDMRSAPVHNRWQEMHRSRGSYGPGLIYGTMQPSSGSASSGSATTSGGGGSGSGAVGVFPNAKIRDCSIPMLLSCSPSVVQGTLSKTSSYSAPSYRAGSEHFNFNKKRDTKKVNRQEGISH